MVHVAKAESDRASINLLFSETLVHGFYQVAPVAAITYFRQARGEPRPRPASAALTRSGVKAAKTPIASRMTRWAVDAPQVALRDRTTRTE